MPGDIKPLSSTENAARLPVPPPASVRQDIADMWHFARSGHRPGTEGVAAPPPVRFTPRSRFRLDFSSGWRPRRLRRSAGSAVPFSLLVIGSRQRALGNLLHDASHRSLDGNRRRSRILANILFCWPLWVSMAIYRNEHNRHHRFLGDPARDPDFIHDENRLPRGWASVWLDQVRSPQMIRSSILGHLGRMDSAQLAGVVCWWGVALALISLASSARDALIFLALWVAARALAFHAITAFREISDHVGLQPGSLIGFSRNHPFSSVLGGIFHPHHNGYHLLHHLTPGMPFHALPSAHALLMRWPRYAAGEHCDSYFTGADERGTFMDSALGAVRPADRRIQSGRVQF